jgi:hypothetical protein
LVFPPRQLLAAQLGQIIRCLADRVPFGPPTGADLAAELLDASGSIVGLFNSPEGESFDRYEAKGHKRFTGILRKWTDAKRDPAFYTREVAATKSAAPRRSGPSEGRR